VSGSITIALDAMGGDAAPKMVIKGANIARKRYPNARFLFFGPEDRLRPLLAKKAKLSAVSEIRDAPDIVTGEIKPSIALRQGRQSSMRRALDSVQAQEAHSMVSAGNTGAFMAMAKFVFKTMQGIDRPAICSFFPTLRGESVMLDLGANVQCDARNLVQFAIMGEVFARSVLGIQHPTIGVLNVGSEALKGNDAVQEAHGTLSGLDLPGHFHGFIEGDDIAKGTVDVVVTDGFTGNVALKTAEGTSRLVSGYLRQCFQQSVLARFGYVLARPALQKLRFRLDPRRYNGAMFLGLNGVAVKSHGGTDPMGFATAIGVAIDTVEQGLLTRIREDFEGLHGQSVLHAVSPTGAAANG